MKPIDTITQEIRYLSFSRKLVLFASLATLLFLFFPWGTRGVQEGNGYEFVPESFSAFGIFPIFGWLLFIMVALTLFILWREVSLKRTHYLGFSNSILWMLTGGIGIYTILIALFVLNSSYLKSFDSQFSLKIGIFLALFMQSLVIFSGIIGKKDDEKTYVKESLSRPYQVDTSKASLAPEPPEEEGQMSLVDYEQ